MNGYLWLVLAITAEVIATTALKAAAGFTRPLPSAITAAGYASAFYALSRSLASIPLATAYALWSALGTAAIAVIGWLVYQQSISPAGIFGLALIIAGVVILQTSSR